MHLNTIYMERRVTSTKIVSSEMCIIKYNSTPGNFAGYVMADAMMIYVCGKLFVESAMKPLIYSFAVWIAVLCVIACNYKLNC